MITSYVMNLYRLFTFTALLFLAVVQGQERNGFDISNSSVPSDLILKGGPPKDGIPAIDTPRFVKAGGEAITDSEMVLGLYWKGVAKAYPIRILNYHEIVNDQFVDEAVLITYCPLCGSGMAFRAEIDGQVLHFGVSGLLYNSDMLMYDRETNSLWSQLAMKAISGALKGTALEMLPLEHMTAGEWTEKHPGTLFLSSDTGYNRNYLQNPYPGYDTNEDLYFPAAPANPALDKKERVIGIEISGKYKAFPFKELLKSEQEKINDNFEGVPLTIQINKETETARVYAGSGELFPSVTLYWFAWYAFHPDTEVYRNSKK